MTDKYTALWLSHSSISAFLECPRSYFLKNVYKDPKTGHKVKLISPPLALGQAVHEVVESLSELKTDLRFKKPLMEKFEEAWKKISGVSGGFEDKDTEYKYKSRGEEMIRKVSKNPGPLGELAVKINMDLPHFWLSETDNVILCGKIDWLRFHPDTDTVEIIDFKTSKNDEGPDSLQLPIYHLLVHYCQNRPVTAVSYWYLDRSDDLTPQKLPDLVKSQEKILKIAKRVKLQRSLNKFDCPEGDKGCRACRPYERILLGDATLVGHDAFKADIYVLNNAISSASRDPKSGTVL